MNLQFNREDGCVKISIVGDLKEGVKPYKPAGNR